MFRKRERKKSKKTLKKWKQRRFFTTIGDVKTTIKEAKLMVESDGEESESDK